MAVKLDPGDAEAHTALAMAFADRGDFAKAKREFEISLRMASNAFEILAFYASWAGSLGEPELGVELAENPVRLNPDFPTWATAPFAWAFLQSNDTRIQSRCWIGWSQKTTPVPDVWLN